VDWYVEAPQTKYRIVADKAKAALNGIETEQVTASLKTFLEGTGAGMLHQPNEKEDVLIFLRLPRPERSNTEDLKEVKLMGRQGNLVPLAELVYLEKTIADKSIYHKNLMPVVYVTGDVAGREESPVYAILKMDPALERLKAPGGRPLSRYTGPTSRLTQLTTR
jgi:multidrug efflux pump subunit AcrB